MRPEPSAAARARNFARAGRLPENVRLPRLLLLRPGKCGIFGSDGCVRLPEGYFPNSGRILPHIFNQMPEESL